MDRPDHRITMKFDFLFIFALAVWILFGIILVAAIRWMAGARKEIEALGRRNGVLEAALRDSDSKRAEAESSVSEIRKSLAVSDRECGKRVEAVRDEMHREYKSRLGEEQVINDKLRREKAVLEKRLSEARAEADGLRAGTARNTGNTGSPGVMGDPEDTPGL